MAESKGQKPAAVPVGPASYSPGPYKVIESLKTALESKRRLLPQQQSELERLQRAMADTLAQEAELMSAIAVLEAARIGDPS